VPEKEIIVLESHFVGRVDMRKDRTLTGVDGSVQEGRSSREEQRG
jgi:hypothetical protein